MDLWAHIITIVFAAGVVYNKVAAVDARLKRIETIFDSVVTLQLKRGE